MVLISVILYFITPRVLPQSAKIASFRAQRKSASPGLDFDL